MAYKRSPIPKKQKSRNLTLYWFLIAILFGIALLNARYSTPQQEKLPGGDFTLADAEFQVHVIDVGQADSILVIADGEAMLIDAAEAGSAETILSYLEAQQITKLKYAAATHMHADHIGGMAQVLNGIETRTVLEPVYADSLVPTTKVYERYLDAIEENNIGLYAAKAGETFTLGNAKITVLGPVSEEPEDLNNTSLVLRVDYGEASCLFTGDMETPEESEILQSGANLDVDLLKVGHHGAATSSSEAFLAAVTPQYAAISCGKNNDYGHPTQEALTRLRSHTNDIRITAEEGSLVFAYDKDTQSAVFTGQTTAE